MRLAGGRKGYEIGRGEPCGREMLLKGSFVPQSSIRWNLTNRAVARTSVRKRNNPVFCISRSSSTCWCKNIEVQLKDRSQNTRHSLISLSSIPKHPELAFDRLQPCDEELSKGQRRPFGRFVTREVILDEEYWTAAWLRAEAHWESVSYMRHVDTYKRKYAEQEFYALKRRCTGRDGNSLKCICIVTEFRKPSGILVSHVECDAHRYAYIANLCVSKFARRQGIASNMLYLAADVAVSSGMKQLFVHVNADNLPAQDLYKKTGFEIVEAASSPLSKDQRLLMYMVV